MLGRDSDHRSSQPDATATMAESFGRYSRNNDSIEDLIEQAFSDPRAKRKQQGGGRGRKNKQQQQKQQQKLQQKPQQKQQQQQRRGSKSKRKSRANARRSRGEEIDIAGVDDNLYPNPLSDYKAAVSSEPTSGSPPPSRVRFAVSGQDQPQKRVGASPLRRRSGGSGCHRTPGATGPQQHPCLRLNSSSPIGTEDDYLGSGRHPLISPQPRRPSGRSSPPPRAQGGVCCSFDDNDDGGVGSPTEAHAQHNPVVSGRMEGSRRGPGRASSHPGDGRFVDRDPQQKGGRPTTFN